jgi:hypothetical protein
LPSDNAPLNNTDYFSGGYGQLENALSLRAAAFAFCYLRKRILWVATHMISHRALTSRREESSRRGRPKRTCFTSIYSLSTRPHGTEKPCSNASISRKSRASISRFHFADEDASDWFPLGSLTLLDIRLKIHLKILGVFTRNHVPLFFSLYICL